MQRDRGVADVLVERRVGADTGFSSLAMNGSICGWRMMSCISRMPARSVFHSRSVDMKFCRMRIGVPGSAEPSTSSPRLSGCSITTRPPKASW